MLFSKKVTLSLLMITGLSFSTAKSSVADGLSNIAKITTGTVLNGISGISAGLLATTTATMVTGSIQIKLAHFALLFGTLSIGLNRLSKQFCSNYCTDSAFIIGSLASIALVLRVRAMMHHSYGHLPRREN